MKKEKNYQRGDVLLVAFLPVIGSEQADIRPAVIVSNELFHRLRIVTVVAVTSRKLSFPGRVSVDPDEGNGLTEPSDILAFQIRTISTNPKRIIKKLGRLSHTDIQKINNALKITLQLEN